MTGMCNLKKFRAGSHVDSRPDDENEHRNPPHYAVDGAVDCCDFIKHLQNPPIFMHKLKREQIHLRCSIIYIYTGKSGKMQENSKRMP